MSTVAEIEKAITSLPVKDARAVADWLHDYLENGKPVAKIVSETQFMSGKEVASLFRGMTPDPETANAIQAELKKLATEAENALDH